MKSTPFLSVLTLNGPPSPCPMAGDVSAVDSECVVRSQTGDREAFEHLVLRHEQAVFRVAWRILRSREDAEDATQETFLRAWRALPRFDAAREFRPWILRIATNVALTAASRRQRHDFHRAVGEQENRIENIPAPTTGDPGVEEEQGNRQSAVQAAVHALAPEDSALFQLRYGEELSIEEIASILEKRPGTVAVALHRLRARLRRLVGDSEKKVKP